MSCGNPNSFGAKFCQNCGESFSAMIGTKEVPKQPKKPIKKPKRVVEEEYDDDDEDIEQEEVTEVPDIQEFKVKVETFGGVQKERLEDILKNPVKPENFKREAPAPVSREQFLAEFQKEAGTMRRNK